MEKSYVRLVVMLLFVGYMDENRRDGILMKEL